MCLQMLTEIRIIGVLEYKQNQVCVDFKNISHTRWC